MSISKNNFYLYRSFQDNAFGIGLGGNKVCVVRDGGKTGHGFPRWREWSPEMPVRWEADFVGRRINVC